MYISDHRPIHIQVHKTITISHGGIEVLYGWNKAKWYEQVKDV